MVLDRESMSADAQTDGLCPTAMAGLLGAILMANGCADEEAQVVAEHLVDANLTGHDSHGIIRILRYDEWLRTHRIHAGRHARTLLDTGTLLHLDGRDGMGQALARAATAEGVKRAGEHGIAIVALRRAGHVGRVGAYAEQAAASGIVSIHFVNVAGSRLVAPFGSAGRAISTAPVAIGIPNADGGDFILDFATSLTAEGKALVAAQGGKPLPADALVDAEGRATGDPSALYGPTVDSAVPDPKAGPGALRAMGGHKGSGLALACELLAGALTGNGTNGPAGHPFGNGMLSVYIDPARLDDADGCDFAGEVADYLSMVRAARPAPDRSVVLVPGDPERARRAERRAAGLSLPNRVLDPILALSARRGIDTSRGALRMAGPSVP